MNWILNIHIYPQRLIRNIQSYNKLKYIELARLYHKPNNNNKKENQSITCKLDYNKNKHLQKVFNLECRGTKEQGKRTL